MGMIQISELARELEVNYSVVIECLVSLGVMERMSPSFVLTNELANQVRKLFSRPLRTADLISATVRVSEK
jgi:hypothetical protein